MKKFLLLVFFALSFQMLYAQGTPTITTKGRYIIGNCGDTLILKGVNYAPYNWGYSSGQLNIPEIALAGANSVRLVWYASGTPALYANSVYLDSAISKCIQKGMIPIIDLHDQTCQNSPTALINLANFYTQTPIKNIIQKYKHSIIINIANEALYVNWTGNTTQALQTYQTTYNTIVANLRNAGIDVPLMIDAPDCGTNLDALASVGNNIINSDSKKNIIFSAHSYWYAYANNDSLTYLNKINNAINANIPFVFGEIANLQDDQQMCQYVLNYKPLLSICETKKIGWLAWSWDNDGCSQRQVSTAGSYSSLTPYGNVVVNNSVYGMRLTAKKSKYLTNSINISIAGPTQYCGTPISITASGGVSYKWSNNATTATISVGAAGTYTVTATDACGHTATANKTIGNDCCSMSGMNFKYQTSNAYNKQVFFYAPTVTGCSNGTKTYLWNFGSGASTPTSTASQPGYITYTTSGLKTVSVTITCTLTDGSTCTMTCSKNVMVSDYQILLNANFGYSISASNPLLTTFAAPSNPAGTTYLWQIFNSSNAQILSATTTNISSYIFSAAGNYNVCLTTTGTTAPSGMNMNKKVCKTITLMSTCNLTPRIVAVQNSATNSYTIAFNNAAVGTVSTWEWDFGDGSPVVTTTNATRTYTTSGTYMVCLTVNKGQANCEGKVCMPVSVGASTCSNNSATTATPTSTPIPPTNAILLENGIIYYDSDKMGEIDPVAFPNPTSAKTNILLGKYAAFDNTITVSDIQGRVLLQQTTGKGNPQTDLDLVELPQGVYIITIKDENGNFTNLKILHD